MHMSKEKTIADQKREELFSRPQNGFDRITPQEEAEMTAYCEDYKAFLDRSMTERQSVETAIRIAEAKGFVPYTPGMPLVPGSKVYQSNRHKAITLAVIGTAGLNEGANICAAHIDVPRIDLKPNPLYEDSELAYFKTHYYGGIRKYQWVTIPLELHGVLMRKDGSSVTVSIGRDEGEPCFFISDLLPHLAQDQSKKALAEAITGEGLNILIGSRPFADDKGSERVKLTIMDMLHEKYGIIEADFMSAELSVVPHFKATDIGLDRSMIGAYGHDDRSCSFAGLDALLRLETAPYKTAVCMLADKEEIGSEGVTGMKSQAFDTFMNDLCESQNASLRRCFENSFCLSGDVCVAHDPLYPEVTEMRNTSHLNYGIGICKYTGARGKSGASDASAEVVGKVRKAFEDNGVIWQMTELGKVDQGGGGTVAAYMAQRNIDTLDAGVPVLAMHAPMEVVSKLDCYMTMRGVKAVYEMK